MFCDPFRQALTGAVAGKALGEDVRAHLNGCESCRTAFAEAQAVQAAMDAGLRAMANPDVPQTLIPRVRAALAQEPSPSRDLPLRWAWAPAAAVAVLLLAVFLPRVLHGPHPRTVPVIAVEPPAVTKQAASENHETGNVRSRRNAPIRRIPGPLEPTRSAVTPEVLVPAGQEEGLLRYVAMLEQRADLAKMLVRPNSARSALIQPLEIPAMESPELKIEPLVKAPEDSSR